MEGIDMSSPLVQEAIEVLGIKKDQLRHKNLSDFNEPGLSEEIKSLRYKYFIRSYKETLQSIKDYIKSKDTKRRCVSALDSRAEHFHHTVSKTKTPKQIREKYRLTLLKFFHKDIETRKKEKTLTDKRQIALKESKISDKIEKFKLVKRNKSSQQKYRFSLIQKEYDDNMQALNEKLTKSTRSTPESRNSSSNKWVERSKSRIEKIREEEEKYLILKMELYNKKQSQSIANHKNTLENRARQMFKHNSKVERVKNDRFRYMKINEEEQALEILAKNQSVLYRREKKRFDTEQKIEKKKRRCQEKQVKVDFCKMEELQNFTKKAENLEKKHFKSLEVLKKNKINLEFRLELKHERDRLKTEDSFEKVSRSRRLQVKSKEDIIKKHLDIENRLKIRKSTQERFNIKLRDYAMQETIERDKAKYLKLKIYKSKEPLSMKSVISDL